jgi:hypothetical protein
MGLLKQNEKEANLLVAKVMRITFVIFTLMCAQHGRNLVG